MVILRLKRGGKKKFPFYQIVASDKRMPRDGRHIERLGYYNPQKNEAVFLKVDLERVQYWLSVGAQMSPSVKSLVKSARQQQEAANA